MNFTHANTAAHVPELPFEADMAALHLRIIAGGGMTEWPDKDVAAGYGQNLVKPYCVQNDAWQQVRLSMKGQPTHVKLAILLAWRDKQNQAADDSGGFDELYLMTKVQVANYLGALRRGGQLDMHNRVRRWC